MNALTNTSRIVADELRKAERSINLAARDTAQFLLTTLDATETHRVSPAMAQRTVRATVAALSSLIDSQEQMAVRAHCSIEKAARQLGLSETSWGENLPKPSVASLEEREPQNG